jgi:hypothetical protein
MTQHQPEELSHAMGRAQNLGGKTVERPEYLPFLQIFTRFTDSEIPREKFNPKNSFIYSKHLFRQMCGNWHKRISNQKSWNFSGTTSCQHQFYQESRFKE